MGINLNFNDTLNAVLMINAFVMYLLHFITLNIQGHKSTIAGTRMKEDDFMKKYAKEGTGTELDKEIEQRWRRIVSNSLETVPLAFVVFAIATTVSLYSESRIGLIVVINVFVFMRILYVICYVNKLQPWRSIVWAISISCILVAAIIMVVDTFKTFHALGNEIYDP